MSWLKFAAARQRVVNVCRFRDMPPTRSDGGPTTDPSQGVDGTRCGSASVDVAEGCRQATLDELA